MPLGGTLMGCKLDLCITLPKKDGGNFFKSCYIFFFALCAYLMCISCHYKNHQIHISRCKKTNDGSCRFFSLCYMFFLQCVHIWCVSVATIGVMLQKNESWELSFVFDSVRNDVVNSWGVNSKTALYNITQADGLRRESSGSVLQCVAVCCSVLHFSRKSPIIKG